MKEDRLPTIFVVTEFKRDSKIESYWYECFHDEDFHGYDVKIVDGSFFGRSDSFMFSDTFFKSVQLRAILNLLDKKLIRDGDIFIFANAWNYIAVPLSYFRDEFELNIHMFGFWGDSLFNQNSPVAHRFRGKSLNWGRQFELTLFNAYDMNCFLCKEHWELFRKKFGTLKGTRKNKWNDQVISRYAITGYPFEYLKRESIVSDHKKDIIVFPYSLKEDIQRDIFADLRVQMPQYEFVFAQEKFNNRLSYHGLLQDAKAMFCANFAEVDPILLYEAMMCGVFPMVPDIKLYEEFFPERYRYPVGWGSWVGKSMRVSSGVLRNKYEVMDYIDGIMSSYDVFKPGIIRDGNAIGNKYYKNGPFLKIMQEVCGRPPINAKPRVRSRYRKNIIGRAYGNDSQITDRETDSPNQRINATNQ